MKIKNSKLTVRGAQKIQDELFKKMTAEQKIKMVGQLFELGKKLNTLNDRRKDGGSSFSCKNS